MRRIHWTSPWAHHAAVAAGAVLLFHLVSIASGKLDAVGGLGWDGFIYARMVAEDLGGGSPNARMRPLVPLMARVPFSLGLSVRESFQLLNYVFALGLYFVASVLLERQRVPAGARLVLVTNLALCIATSKMFGFYPTQVDLGALMVITAAFYFVMVDRPLAGGIACVLAVLSREFGVAVALLGIHRAVRLRRPQLAAAAYLPAIGAFMAMRWWFSWVVGGGDPLSPVDAVANLRFAATPAFGAAFAYFGTTVFGGLSALLIVQPRWIGRIREEPELATYLAVILALSLAGNLDIWRYLAFALPVTLVLVARVVAGYREEGLVRVMAAVTFCTVLTQRPFERMDAALYFRDWFPLYHMFGVQPAPDDLEAVWLVRLASLVLILAVLYVLAERNRIERPAAVLAGAGVRPL